MAVVVLASLSLGLIWTRLADHLRFFWAGVWAARALQLESQPVAQTCAIMEGKLISDCTAEEERLAATTIITIVDGRGDLLGEDAPSAFPH